MGIRSLLCKEWGSVGRSGPAPDTPAGPSVWPDSSSGRHVWAAEAPETHTRIFIFLLQTFQQIPPPKQSWCHKTQLNSLELNLFVTTETNLPKRYVKGMSLDDITATSMTGEHLTTLETSTSLTAAQLPALSCLCAAKVASMSAWQGGTVTWQHCMWL